VKKITLRKKKRDTIRSIRSPRSQARTRRETRRSKQRSQIMILRSILKLRLRRTRERRVIILTLNSGTETKVR
jgi:hypothetical protein